MLIEGLVSALEEEVMPEKTMFLTSSNWALLAKEVEEYIPEGHPKPDPDNFKELIISRRFKVVNSGSEDQKAVDEANIQAASEAHFKWKRDHLITGKKT